MVLCDRLASQLLCGIFPIVSGQIVLRVLGDGGTRGEKKEDANQPNLLHDRVLWRCGALPWGMDYHLPDKERRGTPVVTASPPLAVI
jgi:hypothetical protein